MSFPMSLINALRVLIGHFMYRVLVSEPCFRFALRVKGSPSIKEVSTVPKSS